MEQSERTFKDYVAVLRRRRAPMLVAAGALFALSVAIAFGLPPVYRSTATILIEQQEIPPDLVRSTVTTYADQRIQIISQRVMTSANLTEVIRKFNLYADRQNSDPMELLVDRMRDDIRFNVISADVVDPRLGRPVQATIAFSVSYESRSPQLAQKVTNELASLYLNENLKVRTESARETSAFLGGEGDKLNAQIVELERKLAAFKERHVNTLPENTQFNLQLVERTERELTETERQIRALEERRIYLESQLVQLSPHATVYAETGERILAPEGRLKALETREISMAALYAPDHPDLLKARKEIAALRQELGTVGNAPAIEAKLRAARAELAEVGKKYSADHPDLQRLQRNVASLESSLAAQPPRTAPIKPDNPAYVQLKAQLDGADTELRSLQDSRNKLKGKLASYEQRLSDTPQVESRYRVLVRDHESAQRKYQEIRAKQMEAQLAQTLESERKGERFTLLEPPLLPERPARPNRAAIFLVGIVLSLLGGAGTAAVAEVVDDSVRAGHGAAFGYAPLLGVIPFIENDADVEQRKRRRALAKRGLVASVFCGLAAVALIHLVIMPLDVVWFSVLRRLGM